MTRGRSAKNEWGGHFGYWFTDEYGLPAYEYTCNHEKDARAVCFTTNGFSRDHWHQLGNDRLNLLAHNDGSIDVLDSSRGLQWLCRRDPRRRQPGGGITIIQEDGSGNTVWSDLFSQTSFENKYRRVFGAGYYRKTTRRNGLVIDHVVFSPFSDDPVAVSEVHITNESNSAKSFTLYDYWTVNVRSISSALIYYDQKRKAFSKSWLLNFAGKLLKLVTCVLRLAPEQARDAFSSRFVYESKYSSQERTCILKPVFTGWRRPSKSEPAKSNYYPKPIFLCALDALPTRVNFSTNELIDRRGKLETHQEPFRGKLTVKSSPCLSLGVKIFLEPREHKKLTFLYGYADETEIQGLTGRYRSTLSLNSEKFPLLKVSSQEWMHNLIEFSCTDKTYDWVSRESKWNSYYLRSATLFDEYFENHLLPQGGAYNYLHGLQGVARDFMLYTVPMIYMEPALAREMLEYAMRLMTPEGKLPYATYGFGMQGGAVVHKNPSDLSLSLLWGLSEYLFATRDFDFLQRRIPFYPKHGNASSTVHERIKLALDFLMKNVGFGEHGLIKAGDGDWNDGISTMVRNRGRFVKNGESMFNTALALYVLPRISLLLGKSGDKEYSEKMQAVCKKLSEACLASWNGKWFYRGWDGSGKPIGDRNIFLEPLTWLLIWGGLPKTYADRLIKSIHNILDEPSQFGQYIVYPPVTTSLNYLEKGWDVNGGIWFAMNYLLAWGLSRYDSKRAWRSFIKNSMKHHAETYPDVWYGIWSGPDAFNASYASRPGETYYHIATPTTDFPVMNLNLHANFLSALIKMAGIEPDIEGLTITPSLPFREYSIRTRILELNVSENQIEGSYMRQVPGEFKLRVKLTDKWRDNEIVCNINNREAPVRIDTDQGIAEVQVTSEEECFTFKFKCHTKG